MKIKKLARANLKKRPEKDDEKERT